jgi:hypothetical protein
VLLYLAGRVWAGRGLLAAVRRAPSISGIPVVVISGAPDATTIRATDNVGKAKLLDGLARILKRLRGDDEGAAPSTAYASVGVRGAGDPRRDSDRTAKQWLGEMQADGATIVVE